VVTTPGRRLLSASAADAADDCDELSAGSGRRSLLAANATDYAFGTAGFGGALDGSREDQIRFFDFSFNTKRVALLEPLSASRSESCAERPS
jgi:hypothetical protein